MLTDGLGLRVRRGAFLTLVSLALHCLIGCADVNDPSDREAPPPLLASTQQALTRSVPLLADAVVRGGALADKNYGSATLLAVKGSGGGDGVQQALLKFDLRNVAGTVRSANLRLFGSSPAFAVVRLHAVAGDWSESSVTFRNAPPLVQPLIGARAINYHGWHSWDVTAQVRASLGGQVSFALAGTPSSSTGYPPTFFNAREIGRYASELSVSTDDDGVPETPKMVLGANFWRHTWGNGTRDYFKAGLNWATTSDPWVPQLISDLSYAKVLRFMDWGPVNGSKVVEWGERVPKTGNQYGHQVSLTSSDGSSHTGEGVAYEWQIDLANRAGTDLWINIPHAASDDFVVQLARLINAQLRSDKRVYVEYSNEVWNAGFYQHRFAGERAVALGLPASVSYKGKTLELAPWLRYATHRSLQIFEKFEQVFGPNSKRVVRVLAGQLGYDNWPDYVNTWGDVHPIVNQHMAALASPSLNPKGIKVDAYAVAPYWSGSTIEQMRGSLDRLVEQTRESQRALDLAGLPIHLICYEGGQDGGNQVANARDPAIYSLTMDAYSRFEPLLKGPFVVYTHVGWDATYAWGLKQATTSTLPESHKYRATLDWVRSRQ